MNNNITEEQIAIISEYLSNSRVDNYLKTLDESLMQNFFDSKMKEIELEQNSEKKNKLYITIKHIINVCKRTLNDYDRVIKETNDILNSQISEYYKIKTSLTSVEDYKIRISGNIDNLERKKTQLPDNIQNLKNLKNWFAKNKKNSIKLTNNALNDPQNLKSIEKIEKGTKLYNKYNANVKSKEELLSKIDNNIQSKKQTLVPFDTMINQYNKKMLELEDIVAKYENHIYQLKQNRALFEEQIKFLEKLLKHIGDSRLNSDTIVGGKYKKTYRRKLKHKYISRLRKTRRDH
jgi:uncharacterized protein (DUF3084 family)